MVQSEKVKELKAVIRQYELLQERELKFRVLKNKIKSNGADFKGLNLGVFHYSDTRTQIIGLHMPDHKDFCAELLILVEKYHSQFIKKINTANNQLLISY